MITATRFGSRDDSFAHLTMSFAQYWTSFEKMGEIPVEEAADAIVNSKSGLFDVFGACWFRRFVEKAAVGATAMELSTTGRTCVATGKARLSVCGRAVSAGETG